MIEKLLSNQYALIGIGCLVVFSFLWFIVRNRLTEQSSENLELYRKLQIQSEAKNQTPKKLFTENSSRFQKKNPEKILEKKIKKENNDFPIFPNLPEEANDFVSKTEEYWNQKENNGKKINQEKTKTNFQKNLDKMTLKNTRAIFERDNEGELRLLGIQSLKEVDAKTLLNKPEDNMSKTSNNNGKNHKQLRRRTA